MKKIMYVVIMSLLFIFIFQARNNVSANNDGKNIFEVIDLVYNDNLSVPNIYILSEEIQFRVLIRDDVFINYEYNGDISNNVFFYLENFEEGINNSYIFKLSDLDIRNGNELHGRVYIPKDYFIYYCEDILNIDTLTFYNNIYDYIQDLSNYFKLNVKVKYRSIIEPTFKKIDIIYNENFYISDYRIINENYIELTYALQSDYFINNPYLTDVNNLYSFDNLIVRLLNFDNSNTYFEYYARQYYEIDRDEGIIIAGLRIRKDYFTYYYEEIAQVPEITFFTRFIQDYISDVIGYIKYDVRYVSEDYNYGYLDGYDDGHSDGYDVGHSDGYDAGHLDGYNDGYDVGYDFGHSDGYDAGYDDGYDFALDSEFNVFGYLEALFGDKGLGRLLSLELLPNVTIGAVVMIPLAFFIVSFIFRWFR